MSEWYATADAVFVPLRNIPMFETFIPSKMFEVLATERPIVASVKGEAREILERSGGALVVDPEDAPAIRGGGAPAAGGSCPGCGAGRARRRLRASALRSSRLARRYLDLLARLVRRP